MYIDNLEAIKYSLYPKLKDRLCAYKESNYSIVNSF